MAQMVRMGAHSDDVGRLFRRKSAGCSGWCRPGIPAEVGHPL